MLLDRRPCRGWAPASLRPVARRPRPDPLSPLGDALRESGVEAAIEAAEAQRQAELRARRTRLTERELMQMIFASLDQDAAELDWERLEIVERVDPPVMRETEGPRHGMRPAASLADDPQLGAARPPDPTLPLRARTWAGETWADSFPPGLLPRLPDDHAELVEQAARARGIPRLSLRRLNRGPALAQLRAFVLWARTEEYRIVRVVTGKGVGSKGDPVIRPAVLEWVATEGAEAVIRWAPEPDRGRHAAVLDPEGDFGVLLLELRSRKR